MSGRVQRSSRELLIQSAIAAALGMAVTLLLLSVTAFLVYRRGMGQGREELCVRLAVAFGCLVSSLRLGRAASCGFVIQTGITAASFLLLVIISSSIGGAGGIIGEGLGATALSALVGSALGACGKLVKSNKSYNSVIKKK